MLARGTLNVVAFFRNRPHVCSGLRSELSNLVDQMQDLHLLAWLFIVLTIAIGCDEPSAPCKPDFVVVVDAEDTRFAAGFESELGVGSVLIVGCEDHLAAISEQARLQMRIYFQDLLRDNRAILMGLTRVNDPSHDVRRSVCQDLNRIAGFEAVTDVFVTEMIWEDLYFITQGEPE